MNNQIIESPSTKENSSSRMLWLDVLRLLATVAVIFLHVAGEGYHLPIGEYNWVVAVVGDSLVRWAVPVFVMISGVLFLNPYKEVSKKQMFRNYIPRLLMAYVFWWLAYSFISATMASFKAGTLVLSLSFLEPHFHLWFLPMLTAVYLLVPLLRKIAVDKDLTHYALLLWVTYLTVSFFLMWEIPQISQLFVLNIVVGYAGYFLLGHFVTQQAEGIRYWIIIYFLGVLGAMITIAGNLVFSFKRGAGDETFLNNNSPFVVLMSLALFVAVKQCTERAIPWLTRLVGYVRGDLFGVYLVHGFWLLIFNRSLFRDMTDHIVTLPLITVAVFFGSLYTTKLLRRLPGVKRMVE